MSRSRSIGWTTGRDPGSHHVAELFAALQVILVFAAVSTPAILLVAVLRGDESGSIVSIWSAPDANAWPRGVQEGEPVRFSFSTAA